MGKHHINVGVLFGPGASKKRHGCLGCHRPIVYGDRCPDCQRLVRTRAAKRRRKR
jgi:hypothetical protein